MTKRLTQSELDKMVMSALEGGEAKPKGNAIQSLLDIARRKRGEAEKAPPEQRLPLEGR